jgi:uncharacterized damage-inducible protein DinB
MTMTALEYINHQIAQARIYSNAVAEGLADEQLNWPAPGTTNTVGAMFLHISTSEDSLIHVVIQGKPRVWDSGHWDEKINISKPVSRGDWSSVKDKTFALAPILDYQAAVQAATTAFLATLTEDELSRPLTFAGREETVADILARIAAHASFHAGEISVIKGVHGLKGLPF